MGGWRFKDTLLLMFQANQVRYIALWHDSAFWNFAYLVLPRHRCELRECVFNVWVFFARTHPSPTQLWTTAQGSRVWIIAPLASFYSKNYIVTPQYSLFTTFQHITKEIGNWPIVEMLLIKVSFDGIWIFRILFQLWTKIVHAASSVFGDLERQKSENW